MSGYNTDLRNPVNADFRPGSAEQQMGDEETCDGAAQCACDGDDGDHHGARNSDIGPGPRHVVSIADPAPSAAVPNYESPEREHRERGPVRAVTWAPSYRCRYPMASKLGQPWRGLRTPLVRVCVAAVCAPLDRVARRWGSWPQRSATVWTCTPASRSCVSWVTRGSWNGRDVWKPKRCHFAPRLLGQAARLARL